MGRIIALFQPRDGRSSHVPPDLVVPKSLGDYSVWGFTGCMVAGGSPATTHCKTTQ
jgi:hypothetical protein